MFLLVFLLLCACNAAPIRRSRPTTTAASVTNELLLPIMKSYPTYAEAASQSPDGQAHPMKQSVNGHIKYMAGKEHYPQSVKSIPVRVDKQSPDVARAVTAAMDAINRERKEQGILELRVVNILSARRVSIGATSSGRRREYTLKVQLRKSGGRLEFQTFVVEEDEAASAHPPQTLSPMSEAIVMNQDSSNHHDSSYTYKLVSHQVVRSLLSAPRHRASTTLVPGKVASATTVLKSMRQVTPPPTPPVMR